MKFYYELLVKGGPVTWVIFACGIVATVIVIERLFHFHRAQINVPEFMRGLIKVLKRGNAVEAVSICDDTPGPVAYVLRAAIIHSSKGERRMRDAVDEAGLLEVPRLERSVSALATIASLSPLLGLLGTVVGMIALFQDMAVAQQFVDVKTLADGIWGALISTAAGLIVGIPAWGFYNHFVRRIDGMVLDMEKAAAELIFFLSEHPVAPDSTGAAADAAEPTASDVSASEPDLKTPAAGEVQA
jgi:biopolymer transport protein ExbB